MHANLEHAAEPTIESQRDVSAVRAHACFGCLTGATAEKRACAAARMLSEGFDPALVSAFSPSSKKED